MFSYPKDYEDSKAQLQLKIDHLKKEGFEITESSHEISRNLSIDKIVIKIGRASCIVNFLN